MATRIAMPEPKPLPKSFYRKRTAEVARALLGCRLTRRLPDGSERSVILVETEAYLGVKDRAAHTWNGRRTPRVEPMWGEGGHAYVYFVYGMHFCMNVVTRGAGEPEAVLLRAGISEEAFAEERKRKRGKEKISLKGSEAGRRGRAAPMGSPPLPSKQNLLLSGPAKLCAYLGVTTALSGASFAGPELLLSRGPRFPFSVLAGPRVGVDYAGEAASWPLRFAVAGIRSLAKPGSLRPFVATS
jgi:DNA-3-methyladenine glycosylase